MPAARSAAIVVIACVATAALAACQSHTPVAARSSSTLKTAPTDPAASSAAIAPSAPVPATSPTTAPSTTAPVTSSASAPAASPSAQAAMTSATAPPPSCASAPGADIPDSSITVCPDAGPVGSVVHVTIEHCAPTGNGLPDLPAAGLFFLGPKSWLGTNGGGGAYVPYWPQTGHQATATFTIPATYTGGNQHGPYPTLAVTPGTGYEFATDPAGECHIAFTVTAP
jgi:hypothetical protein